MELVVLAEQAVSAEPVEPVERGHRLVYQHNRPEEQTAHQVEALQLLNGLHLQTIMVQTDQVQMYLHHPAAGAVEDIVAEEEAEDLAAAEEVVVAEEDDELNFILYHELKRAVRNLFSDGLFLIRSILHY